jgi:FkbM family methyltransferase
MKLGELDLTRYLTGWRVTDITRRLLTKGGIHATRAANTLVNKRQEILRAMPDLVVLDVGANEGQYADELRSSGFGGKLICVEPDPKVFELLKRGRSTGLDQCLNVGLGAVDGTMEFKVRRNSTCSSFLPSVGNDLEAMFDVVASVPVPVRRLDSLILGQSGTLERYYLKIDTQGFEREVLLGAAGIANQIDALEVELSLSAMYEGQALLPEIWQLASEIGLRPAWVDRGYRHPTDIWLMQVDVLFLRESSWAKAKLRQRKAE